MKMKKYTLFSILFLFSLSVLMMIRQLASNSFFLSMINDVYTYTSWTWQFTEALKEGTIYPRWMALDFWGYGAPTFILYCHELYKVSVTLSGRHRHVFPCQRILL
jgi:hypothetical protein